MKNNKKNVIWFSEIRWDYMTTRKQHLIKRLSNNYNFIFIEPYKKNEKYYLYRKEKNIIIITIPTFKLGNKQQEHNLIDALKVACRKFTKEITGKKPLANINLIKI